MNSLDVPYVGQVGQGANVAGNDCGAASASMILLKTTGASPTVDELYREAHPSGNTYLGADEVMQMLAKRGVSSEWRANVSTMELFGALSSTRLPVIALLNYGRLAVVRPNTFKGSHFLVVIGMDLDTVYVNDPLNTPTSGEGIGIPMRIFEDAWNNLADGNPQRGLILPTKVQSVALRMVKVNSYNGLAVRSIPAVISRDTLLRYVVDKTVFTIYEEKDGWGRVHPTKAEWICMMYTT